MAISQCCGCIFHFNIRRQCVERGTTATIHKTAYESKDFNKKEQRNVCLGDNTTRQLQRRAHSCCRCCLGFFRTWRIPSERMNLSGTANLTNSTPVCTTGPFFVFAVTGDILIAGVFSILLDVVNIIISVPLNLLVILTISLNSSLRRNSDFILLLLAVSDLLTATTQLPLHLANKTGHLLGRPSCSTASAYTAVRVLLTPLSVLSVALVGLERALCVLKPYWYLENITRRHLFVPLFSLWFLWTVGDMAIRYGRSSPGIANLISGGFLAVLLVGNLACSGMLVRVSRRHENQIHAQQTQVQLPEGEKQEIARENKALWSAIYINATYFATYFPAIIAVVILAIFDSSSAQLFHVYCWVTSINMCVASANPIILCWRNSRLSREMKKLARLDNTVHHGHDPTGPAASAPTGWDIWTAPLSQASSSQVWEFCHDNTFTGRHSVKPWFP